MSIPGRATSDGTARYAARFGAYAASGYFRPALGLTLSSVGAGTYLGDLTDGTDAGYRTALIEAMRHGCNVLDTAVSYRAQRSEMALGQAVADAVASGDIQRDELVVATKGGFITHRLTRPADLVDYVYQTYVATGIADPDELAGGIHCLGPNYLSQQIAWSLRNTGLRSLDIYYIHNPETQLAFVDRKTFRKRLQLAFARLEEEVLAGRIGCYGVATWDAFRRPPIAPDYMSLETMMQLVTEVAGPDHHLAVVQLPFNAAMTEAASFKNQPLRRRMLPALAAAGELGLTVIASAALMQGDRAERISVALRDAFRELEDGPLRALQFARSATGVTTALYGTTSPEHARQNQGIASHPVEREKADRLARLLAR